MKPFTSAFHLCRIERCQAALAAHEAAPKIADDWGDTLRYLGQDLSDAREKYAAWIENAKLSAAWVKAAERYAPAPISSLSDLLEAIIIDDERFVTNGDWSSSMPSFGGDEPEETAGVWSWDAESVLIGTCLDDIEIISREEYAELYLG